MINFVIPTVNLLLIFALASCTQKKEAPIEYKTAVSLAEHNNLINKNLSLKTEEAKSSDEIFDKEILQEQATKYAFHRVSKGETLELIATKYGTTAEFLADLNDLLPPYFLEESEVLQVPLVQYEKIAPHVKKGATLIAGVQKQSGFIAPVEGEVVQEYNALNGGVKGGVIIDAALDQPIRAARGGKVTIVGNNQKFGNYIIVRTSDNILVAYGHMQNILTKKDDLVKRGQIIGYIGASGEILKSGLYFAIKQGGKSVDPLKWLPHKISK